LHQEIYSNGDAQLEIDCWIVLGPRQLFLS